VGRGARTKTAMLPIHRALDWEGVWVPISVRRSSGNNARDQSRVLQPLPPVSPQTRPWPSFTMYGIPALEIVRDDGVLRGPPRVTEYLYPAVTLPQTPTSPGYKLASPTLGHARAPNPELRNCTAIAIRRSYAESRRSAIYQTSYAFVSVPSQTEKEVQLISRPKAEVVSIRKTFVE